MHVTANGLPVAVVSQTISNGTATTTFLHQDALDSTALKTTPTTSKSFLYEPFGNRVDMDGVTAVAVDTTEHNDFAGQEHDELNLINMKGRLYDPSLRRFLTADPHIAGPVTSQGYAPYSYARNNPVRLKDPSGYDPVPINSSYSASSAGYSVNWYDTDDMSVSGVAYVMMEMTVTAKAAEVGTPGSLASRGPVGVDQSAVKSQSVASSIMPDLIPPPFQSQPLTSPGEEGNAPFVPPTIANLSQVIIDGGYTPPWELTGEEAWRPATWQGVSLTYSDPSVRESLMRTAAYTDFVKVSAEIGLTAASLAPPLFPATDLMVVARSAEAVEFFNGAAEGGGLVASDAINAPRLASDLVRAEAESAFTGTGELSSGALQGSRQIVAPGELGNTAIPQGFGKYATESFNSPSGPFQVHFYMNPTTNEMFYGLDYKAIFNAGVPSRFVPPSGLAP
jgi:RHS repeat-associated protein